MLTRVESVLSFQYTDWRGRTQTVRLANKYLYLWATLMNLQCLPQSSQCHPLSCVLYLVLYFAHLVVSCCWTNSYFLLKALSMWPELAFSEHSFLNEHIYHYSSCILTFTINFCCPDHMKYTHTSIHSIILLPPKDEYIGSSLLRLLSQYLLFFIYGGSIISSANPWLARARVLWYNVLLLFQDTFPLPRGTRASFPPVMSWLSS